MSSATSQFHSVTAEWVVNRVLFLWKMFQQTGERQTLYIEGPPGGGKTAVIHYAATLIAEMLGRTLVDSSAPGPDEFGLRVIHLGNVGEEVAAGLPWVNKETSTLHRAMDALWPTTGEGILYLDEPFQHGPMQRYAGQLTSEGRIGEYELGQWLVVMSGNSQSDRAGAVRIWTHVQNRIEHVVYEPEVSTVLANFRQPAVPEIAVYLRWFPEKLHGFHTKGGPFTSPRAWDKVNSNMAMGLDPTGDGYPTVQGLIGPESALDFKVTFDAVKDLPDLDDMLANPDDYRDRIRAMGNNNAASICAMASVFVRRYGADRDLDMADRAIRLIHFASPEHVASFVAICETLDDEARDGQRITDTPAYVRYMAEESDLTAN